MATAKFMMYEDLTALRDTEIHNINKEIEEVDKTHKKEVTILCDKKGARSVLFDKQLKTFSNSFEKEVRALFKGIKIKISHNQYEFTISYNDKTLFTHKYNNTVSTDIECHNQLVDIYNMYYGYPKELTLIPYEDYSRTWELPDIASCIGDNMFRAGEVYPTLARSY